MTQTLKSAWSKLEVPIIVLLALVLAACALNREQRKDKIGNPHGLG